MVDIDRLVSTWNTDDWSEDLTWKYDEYDIYTDWDNKWLRQPIYFKWPLNKRREEPETISWTIEMIEDPDLDEVFELPDFDELDTLV